MNREVMAEFERLIHRVRDDRETRVLIVTGTGAAFSAGADVSGASDVQGPQTSAGASSPSATGDWRG